MHCHNTVHEDHQMMLLWQIQPPGQFDNNTRPRPRIVEGGERGRTTTIHDRSGALGWMV